MTSASGRRLFWWSAGGALALHAAVLIAAGPLHGGADLRPHLRLVQRMGEEPSLRSVYAPAYHVLGALAAPFVGLAEWPRVFAFAAAAALILGFRFFQRAAGLPDAAAALFAWSPYLFALSWCSPKIEAGGYALAFVGLGLVCRGRAAALAAILAGTFLVHTAAALFLGLCGGGLALARRDARCLAGLAAGSALAAPLFGAHLLAGCTVPQALLFSPGDYLRDAPRLASFARWDVILALAGPVSLGAAGLGVRRLWEEHREVALLCLLVCALYLNELWLAPFGARTTLDLVRGLTVLALPVAIAAGCAVEGRARARLGLVAACAAWAAACAWLVVPDACFTRRHDLAEITSTQVARCTFRWR